MNNLLSSIYIDYSRNMWKFQLDEENNLCYKVMYEEGEWDKETIIDRGVLSFSVYVNEDEAINIIYSNNRKEIKYCTMRSMKWVGKVVYKIDEEDCVLTNIKIIINEEKMHIFFLQRDYINGIQGIINHCIWDGENIKNIVIQEIVLMKNLNEYYSIILNEDKGIDLFFLDDEGEEVSLNRCTFINNKWTSIKRLYGIQGNNIEFDIILDNDSIRILNKYKENDSFFLEYVTISMMEVMKEYRIYNSNTEPLDPRIIIHDNKVFCFWVEENKIYYSSFKKVKWNEASTINIGETSEIKGDNCFIWSNKEECIKKVKVYVINEDKMKLFIPSKFLLGVRDYHKNKENEVVYSVKKFSRGLKKELMKVRSEKKQLESNVSYLNMKLKKRQNQLLEYKENLNLVMEQKKEVDENCKAFLEIQEKNKEELQIAIKKLEKKKEEAMKYEGRIEKMEKERLEKEELIDNLENTIEELNKKLDIEKKERLIIENTLEQEKRVNELMKKQIQSIILEKERLLRDLEAERNQSIMGRILRRKSNDI